MKFWQAFKALQEDGAKIRRKGIHGKNEYYYFDKKEGRVGRKLGPDPEDVDFDSYISLNFIYDEDGDWEIIEEPHDFQWAIQKLKEGRKVKRTEWVAWSIYLDKEEDTLMIDFETRYSGLSIEDIEAADWVLAE